MEKPDKEGKFRYVCYSSADYSPADQSSPLTADFSWWEIPQIYQGEGFRRVDAVIVDEDNLFRFKERSSFVQPGRGGVELREAA